MNLPANNLIPNLVVLLTILSLLGCTSTSSTFLTRTDHDQWVGNSNGYPSYHCSAKPFKGVPVTIPIVTHVDIAIYETYFFEPESLNPIRTHHRNLRAEATPIRSDKIFSVDPKKAAAGTSRYTLDMNSGAAEQAQRQYFKQIKFDIEDRTIQDINTALSGLLPILTPPTSIGPSTSRAGLEDSDPIIQRESMVAWKRFDVNAVDFQQQVTCFVGEHLNDCHSCQH